PYMFGWRRTSQRPGCRSLSTCFGPPLFQHRHRGAPISDAARGVRLLRRFESFEGFNEMKGVERNQSSVELSLGGGVAGCWEIHGTRLDQDLLCFRWRS